MGTKQSIFQPGHDGKRASVPIHDGMTVSHVSHAAVAGEAAHGGNIALDSTAGKHRNIVPVNAASHRVSGTNIGAPAVTTLDSIPDASNPNVLDPTKQGKRFAPVQAVLGQRSRSSDACGPGQVQGGVSMNHERGKGKFADHVALGKAIIGEALSAAPCDHPSKLGRA